MFKILISIQCEECGDCHSFSVLSKEIDPISWRTDASTLQADAEGIGWDFFQKARCPHCSGASGELFREHPGDYYGELVYSATDTPLS